MRHRHGFRKLNITDGAHRRAMMRHICNALIEHEAIKTTLPRAKELRRFIEPLITLGKKPTVHNRRMAFARLQDRKNVTKLFDELGVRFLPRPGGYVRVLKYGFRKGDCAPMAWVEFVDKAPEDSAETIAASEATAGKKAKAAKVAKAAKSAKAKSAKADKKADAPIAAATAKSEEVDNATAQATSKAETSSAKVADTAAADVQSNKTDAATEDKEKATSSLPSSEADKL